MKRMKKLMLSLLAAAVVFSNMGISAKAEYNQYKVTVYAGNKGVFADGSDIQEYQVTAGGLLTGAATANSIQVTDEKYYVKGFRISGQEQSFYTEIPTGTPFNADTDFVVAYGIAGDMVEYTVQYLDENGNELAPSAVYYANVGDKPVIAYQYIEGYVPQALAMTGTLSDNAADNVFTFEYTPGDSGQLVETITTVTVTTPAGTTAGGTTAGTGTAAGTGAAAGAGTDAGAAGTDEAGTDTTDETQSPDEETPQALVDLDDEETPLGDIEADEESNDASAQGIPLAAGIATGVVAIIALAAIFVVFFKKRLH
ncbi:hypothetical protein K280104A7_31370 [Candidatus Bariatricus faecipullorum]